MEKREKIYEGKAKIVYSTSDPGLHIILFKDSITAFDGLKKEVVEGKGSMNLSMSARLFTLLNQKGIKTHFMRRLNEREMLVRALAMFPVEVVVRNISAGSLCRRYGIREGLPLKPPVLELFYKSDPLHDPLVNRSHIRTFGWAADEDVKEMEKTALRVNHLLLPFFEKRGLILVDHKLEFGASEGKIFIGDEITPDSCRIWEEGTREKLDKDVFRFDMGYFMSSYRRIMERITGDD